MDILKQVDEIFTYLKKDAGYVAITGTIWKDDIDQKKYTRQSVEGQSFDHEFNYQSLQPYSDDEYNGVTLIPIGEGVYLYCEWAS